MQGANATLSVWEACLLGVVQGLTEYLPVSSKGHLALVQHFLSPMPAADKVAVDVALHIGTLVAVFLYFRVELLAMQRALVAPRRAGWAWSWIWYLGLATLPAAVVVLPLKDRLEAVFDSVPAIGAFLLLTGTLLFLGSAVRGADRTEDEVSAADALFIGCFQAGALLPGVSRSATTITAGLFRRLRGDVAAKFSFLLSIPTILGAVATEGKALFHLSPAIRGPLVIGIVVSGLSGLVAIAALLRLVQERRLVWFAYYCRGLGTFILAGCLIFGTT